MRDIIRLLKRTYSLNLSISRWFNFLHILRLSCLWGHTDIWKNRIQVYTGKAKYESTENQKYLTSWFWFWYRPNTDRIPPLCEIVYAIGKQHPKYKHTFFTCPRIPLTVRTAAPSNLAISRSEVNMSLISAVFLKILQGYPTSFIFFTIRAAWLNSSTSPVPVILNAAWTISN